MSSLLFVSVYYVTLNHCMFISNQEPELQLQEFQTETSPTAQRYMQCSTPSACHCGSPYCYQHQDMLPHVSYEANQGQEAASREMYSGQHVAKSAIKDPGKHLVPMGTVGFSDLADAVQLHIYTVGPVPNMNLFHLFRKVDNQLQVDRALGILMDDRDVRVSQGLTEPYDEVCSDKFVVHPLEYNCWMSLVSRDLPPICYNIHRDNFLLFQ